MHNVCVYSLQPLLLFHLYLVPDCIAPRLATVMLQFKIQQLILFLGWNQYSVSCFVYCCLSKCGLQLMVLLLSEQTSSIM